MKDCHSKRGHSAAFCSLGLLAVDSPSCSASFCIPVAGGGDWPSTMCVTQDCVIIKECQSPLFLLSATACMWWELGKLRMNEFYYASGKVGEECVCGIGCRSLLCFLWACWNDLTEHFGSSTCWKKVLLGEIISDTNEKTSLDIAQKICHYFIEETNAVLQKVCF